MKDLWMRLGAKLSLTDDELDKLIGEDVVPMKERERIIVKVVAEGRFSLEGETYVPGEAVEDLNDEYDTSFEENDYELYW